MDNQKLSIMPKYGYGFIYCYTSPSGKKYIGKTKTSLKTRAGTNARGYKGCVAFYNAIQKYGWDNFEVDILEEVPLENILIAETQYIIEYDTANPDKGYNIITNYHSFLSTLNRIPIYSYDGITGIFLESYSSITEAEQAMGVVHWSIGRVLNKPANHVKGRLWRTEKFDRIEVIQNNVQPHSKKVYMYDSKTGCFLEEFNSIREAARQTGYNRCTIQEHISRNNVKKGKKHTFKNFKVSNLYDESSTTIPSGVDSSESKRK